MPGRSSVAGLLAATVLSGALLSACIGHTTTATSHPSVPATGLCAFVDRQAVAQILGGQSNDVLFASLPPAAGQSARCEFDTVLYDPRDPSQPISLSLAPTMQNGVNEYAKLQASPSVHSININGYELAWDPSHAVLRVRFTDKNRTYASSPQGTDSILTIADPDDATSRTGLAPQPSPFGWLVTFAGQVADEIGAGHIVSPTNCGRCQGWGQGPMLVDDRGRPVVNPILVLQVYAALVAGDTDQLGVDGYGYNVAGTWDTFQMPYLSRASARAAIARSMTVHPNCDDGCTYPDFAVTGWTTAGARADGPKLGVDPAQVPDPTLGHNLPVYTSNFPSCMCSWNGIFPPGT